MIKEGRGAVAPKPVEFEISRHDLIVCAQEARRRCSFRGYSAKNDQWSQGMLGSFTLPDGSRIESGESPIMAGNVGEIVVSRVVGAKVDFSLRNSGDSGRDFSVNGHSIQAKTITKPTGYCLVKTSQCEAELFAWCEWLPADPFRARFLGWSTNRVVKSCEVRRSRVGGWNNYVVPVQRLRPARELTRYLYGEAPAGIIRYPGSKRKFWVHLRDKFPEFHSCPMFSGSALVDYREPFVGSGATAARVLPMLRKGDSIWLNDADPAIAAIWKAILSRPKELADKVAKFVPTVDGFFDFKERDGEIADIVDAAFRKIALHQMSVSGWGAMSGGPIGGRKQSSAYSVQCRWSPVRLIGQINGWHAMLSGVNAKITCGDFSHVIDSAGGNAFIYADPPYFEAGPALYRHSFSEGDHRRLAESLKSTSAQWILSYDDAAEIRQLYDGCDIEGIEVKYTNARAKEKRASKTELIISPRARS